MGKSKWLVERLLSKKEQNKRKSEKTTKSFLELSITPVISINAPPQLVPYFSRDFCILVTFGNANSGHGS